MLFHFCYKEVYLAMDDIKIRILLWNTKPLLTTQGGSHIDYLRFIYVLARRLSTDEKMNTGS